MNTTPLPSLFEGFAILESNEWRCRILSPPAPMSGPPLPIPDQMAFTASLGPRLTFGATFRPCPTFGAPLGTCNRPYCQHCRQPGYTIDRYFNLHPELRQ